MLRQTLRPIRRAVFAGLIYLWHASHKKVIDKMERPKHNRISWKKPHRTVRQKNNVRRHSHANIYMNMKRLFSFLCLMVACCSIASALTIHREKSRDTDYSKFLGKEEIVKSPETPSGITRIPAGAPFIATSTNRVPAKIGVIFGFWYEIDNVPALDGEVGLTTIVRHPSITKPDGTVSNGFTTIEKQDIKSGRVVGMTGYELDHDYELVAGDWQFEMQYGGVTVCKQKFTVFKE